MTRIITLPFLLILFLSLKFRRRGITKPHHTTLNWIASPPLISRFPLRCVVSCVTPSIFPFCAGGDGSRDHVLSRLEHVWGPGDGRPVEDLKVAIDQVSCQSSHPKSVYLDYTPVSTLLVPC